jgi:hypothetical protein
VNSSSIPIKRHRSRSGIRSALQGIVLAVITFTSACGGETGGWTVPQAETIATVRGMRIHNSDCRGEPPSRSERYQRFTCVAGTGLPSDRYDTVAVTYVLRPLGEYRGAASKYVLSDVHFIGGPGIP